MKSFVFMVCGIALTIICWGSFGPVMLRGQHSLGSDRLKPLICVGVAFFIVAIVVPSSILAMQGRLQGDWTFSGISWSLVAGICGALGALGIILALTNHGKPLIVMPLIFGGAPIVNVLMSMRLEKISWKDAGPTLPVFLAGVIIVIVGTTLVLVFAPKAQKAKPHGDKPAAVAKAEPSRGKPSGSPPAKSRHADANKAEVDSDRDVDSKSENNPPDSTS